MEEPRRDRRRVCRGRDPDGTQVRAKVEGKLTCMLEVGEDSGDAEVGDSEQRSRPSESRSITVGRGWVEDVVHLIVHTRNNCGF